MATPRARSIRWRRPRWWLGGLGLLLLVGFAGVALAIGTTVGGRVVLSLATRLLPDAVQVTVGDFSGRLVNRFELDAVHVRIPEAEMTVERVSVEWRLADLLRRRVHARSVRIERVSVQWLDETPGEAPRPAVSADSAGSTTPPFSDLPVHVSVDSIFLGSLTVRRGDSVWVEDAAVRASGTPEDYGLEIAATATIPGLPAASVYAGGRGSNRALRVDSLAARVLEGSVSAEGIVSWWPEIGWNVSARVDTVRPAGLLPDPEEWTGALSSRLSAVGGLTAAGTLKAELEVDTLHGVLRGESVEGAFSIRADGRELDIRDANLAWGPARLRASGTAADSLDLSFELRIPDLALLVPGAAGRVTARGRAAGTRAVPRIQTAFDAEAVQFAEVRVGAASGEAELDFAGPLRGSIETRALRLAGYEADSATLVLTGRRSDHRLEAMAHGAGVELQMAVEGSLNQDNVWSGTIGAFRFAADTLGSWALGEPASLQLGAGEVRLDGACLDSAPTRICAEGEYGNGAFRADATVDSLDLSRFDRFLPDDLSVRTIVEGEVRLDFDPEDGLQGTVGIRTSAGELTLPSREGTRTLRFAPAVLTAEAGSGGTRGEFELHLTDTASVRLLDATGWFETPAMIRTMEDLTSVRGHSVSVHAELGSEDLSFLSKEILPRWSVEGSFTADTDVDISPDGGLDGRLTAATEGLTLRNTARAQGWILNVDPANLQLEVGPEGLSGTTDMVISSPQDGELLTAAGRIRLPSFTSLEFEPDRQPVEGSLEVRLGSLEIVPAFTLDVAEAKGSFLLTTRLGGTLADITVDGEATLSDGYALLPILGLELEDIGFHAEGRPDGRIEVSGQLRSGEGLLTLSGRSERYPSAETPTVFQVRGDRVQVLDIPDVNVLASPELDLAFNGTRADVTGRVMIPRARLGFPEIPPSAVVPSDDVVIVGDTAERRQPPIPLTADIQVTLGDDVTFNGFGFAAGLRGDLRITQEAREEPVGRGEIRFVNGTYRSFGQELRIDPGALRFNGPIDNPAVDARAYVRASDGTEAGLRIGGTVQSLAVSTYSVPPRTESDVMSYILFGRPMSETSGAQSSQATNTAAVLGANMLAMSLAPSVGLDEARIDTGGSQNEAQFVVGKYLSPKVYVGYGVGLYEPISTFRLRYILSSRWSIEAITGDQQSTDLLWRIEAGGPKPPEETGEADDGAEPPSSPAGSR